MSLSSLAQRSSYVFNQTVAAKPHESFHRDAQAYRIAAGAAGRHGRAGFYQDLSQPSFWVRSHLTPVPAPLRLAPAWDGSKSPHVTLPAALCAVSLGLALCTVRTVGVLFAVVLVGPMYALARLAVGAWTKQVAPVPFAWCATNNEIGHALAKRLTRAVIEEEALIERKEWEDGPQTDYHSQLFMDLARDVRVHLVDAWGVNHSLQPLDDAGEKFKQASPFAARELTQMTDGDVRWQRQVTYLTSQITPLALLSVAIDGAGVRRLNDHVYPQGVPTPAVGASLLFNSRSELTFTLSRAMDAKTERRTVLIHCDLSWDAEATRTYAQKMAALQMDGGLCAPLKTQGMRLSAEIKVTQPNEQDTFMQEEEMPAIDVSAVRWFATQPVG
jgi:hypothetical protein